VWLLTLSLINQHVLLSLDVSPGKSVLWWITVLSGGWVVCRSLLQSQSVFYPQSALQVVHELVRHLPAHFIRNSGERNVLHEFYQLFPLRLVILLKEFAGLLITPFVLMKRIYPNAEQIIETFHMHTRCDNLRGEYYYGQVDDIDGFQEEDVPLDFDERSVLNSIHLVPYLQNLDTAVLRAEQSI
jgi:hypothetical protein